MAGRYIKLVEGRGFIESETALVVHRAEFAEEEADIFLDAVFSDWDRTWWSPTSLPQEAQHVGLRVASAFYLRQQLAKTNPEATDKAQYADFLFKEAQEMADRIVRRGWIVGLNNERLYPENRTNQLGDI